MEATLVKVNTHTPATTTPQAATAGDILLSVRDLHVEFNTSRGRVRAVEGVSYDVRRGEILAIVGESGCGKSVSSLSIMRLLPKRTARVTKGEILFGGRNLLKLSDGEMRRIRGREIGMIFQEPMTSLNPVLSIGSQIMEPLFIHLEMSKTQARERAIELLNLVGITDPERRLEQYPHPAFRRHAAARDDRHRAGLRAQAPHRRRADHRARRHDPGANP
jgi:peptide/nickel transport system ATP-binding protein